MRWEGSLALRVLWEAAIRREGLGRTVGGTLGFGAVRRSRLEWCLLNLLKSRQPHSALVSGKGAPLTDCGITISGVKGSAFCYFQCHVVDFVCYFFGGHENLLSVWFVVVYFKLFQVIR